MEDGRKGGLIAILDRGNDDDVRFTYLSADIRPFGTLKSVVSDVADDDDDVAAVTACTMTVCSSSNGEKCRRRDPDGKL